MASSYRQTFDKLRRAIRADAAELLEFQSVESGAKTVMICAVRRLPFGQLEYQPLAKLFDAPQDPIVLSGPTAPAVRAAQS